MRSPFPARSSRPVPFRVGRHRRPGAALLVPVLLALIAAAGPALGGVATGAQGPTRVTVALDWYPNANHAGLFLAAARGYFAAEGIEVEFLTPADATTPLQTVGAGTDTFGISYQTDVLLARAQGVPVVSIAALVQRPLLGVMSLRAAGIARPRDLVGKTVGYPGIPSQEAFLATMLEADGASLADVDLVDVGFGLVPAVVSGRADAAMGAYWTHETILAEREGFPVDLLRVEEWGVPPYYELVLVANERTVADDPATARALLRAMQRGHADAAANPAAALDALAAASPELDRGVEEAGLALLVPTWTEGGVAVGTQDPARWAAFAAWMVDRGLLPADLDPAAAYTTTLLPETMGTPVASPVGSPVP